MWQEILNGGVTDLYLEAATQLPRERMPTMEMSSATMGLAIMLIGLASLGVVPRSSLTIGFCGSACIATFVLMLFRLNLYTGRAQHHMQVARASWRP
jgi:hypothetical protein